MGDLEFETDAENRMSHSIHLLQMRIKFARKNETNEVKTMHRAQVDKVVPISRPNIDADDFRKKQEEATKKLGAQSSPTAPITQKPAINANTLNAKADNQAVQQVSRADRLAELRKQSQESVKKTESILEPEAPVLTPAPQAIVEDVIEKQEQDHVEESTVVESDNETTVEDNKSSKNVFKQIVTNTPKETSTVVVDQGTMILVVDANQRSRNLIDKNTTITNTLHRTFLTMIVLLMNIVRIYLDRFGRRANELVLKQHWNLFLRKKNNSS